MSRMRTVHTIGIVLACGLAWGAGKVQAAVVFHTDLGAFTTAAGTTSLVDFEGIVADSGVLSQPSQVVGGATFTAPPPNAVILGKTAVTSVSFDSAILAADVDVTGNTGNTINIDLTTAGSGFTAVGGFFGEFSLGHGNTTATLTLLGPSGTLDTQSVVVGSLTAGAAKTFFGWTATAGDTVTGITYALPNNNNFGIDDIRFDKPGGSIPEPATLALFALGLVGLGTLRRRAKV